MSLHCQLKVPVVMIKCCFNFAADPVTFDRVVVTSMSTGFVAGICGKIRLVDCCRWKWLLLETLTNEQSVVSCRRWYYCAELWSTASLDEISSSPHDCKRRQSYTNGGLIESIV
eukprot:TRINITY_DN81531_c0_g1_i1.p1 TRINITY_DN81531_c0_g1~~TRINITY_DN81531_c0_g1_i1.p1  ORF type:complete len:114 (+),score=5.57 TRINITY_DN81531_c0_g1_i1:470-811(+)